MTTDPNGSWALNTSKADDQNSFIHGDLSLQLKFFYHYPTMIYGYFPHKVCWEFRSNAPLTSFFTTINAKDYARSSGFRQCNFMHQFFQLTRLRTKENYLLMNIRRIAVNKVSFIGAVR